MSDKSMIDICYDVLLASKKPIKYTDLFNKVSKIKGLTEQEKESKIAVLYTDLFMDKRFCHFDGNKWDLTERYKYDEVQVNIQDEYAAIDNEEKENLDVDDYDDEEKKILGLTSENDEDSSSKEDGDN